MPALKKIGAAALAAFGWTSGGASAVTASYLVVAGGGGGGGAGGGGGGGYQTNTTSLSLATSYTVTVGAGGAGAAVGANTFGGNGSNSSFGSLTASVGGGGGGAYSNTGGTCAGLSGGSGGGGGNSAGGGGSLAGGAGTSGQGNAGGTGSSATAPYASGGGGGAGAVGGNATSSVSGNGGAGLSTSITGSTLYFSGGGGGGAQGAGSTAGNGGTGGGGGGANGYGGTAVGTGGGSSVNSGGNGTYTAAGGVGGSGGANSGGGGGGMSISAATSGAGGSGIVIISYTGSQQFGGGIVTSVGGNTIHTFLTSGTLSPLSSLSASYLIVAGGGGGVGGGGGAGGMLTGSSLTIDTASTYLVTVGAGSASQGQGNNSNFGAVATTALGGGHSSYSTTATSGGSGAGGAYAGGSAWGGGAGTSGQGNAGGSSVGAGTYNGAGGGGAGAAATNSSADAGSNGGVGLSSSISGTATYYAGGGGGGGSTTSGTGGLGGGGNGALASATDGAANTGGGGGGAFTTYNGLGGSGIVIISYAGSTQQMAGGSVTIVGGNVIHTFTSSGYLTPLTYYTNSLRFRSSATAYLSRTPTVASNRQKFTMSFWFKRSKFDGTGICFLGSGVSGSDFIEFYINGTTGALQIYDPINSISIVTNAVFRDPAAWYHMVFAVDTTQATASNRIIIYVNGGQQSLSTATYPAQNANTYINSTTLQTIGTLYLSGTAYDKLDGYMTAINFIDGQALTPNSFGTFNSYGVWQPINYGGSYGTNGFYLPFTNKTSTTTLGYDFSPAGNNWTPNNISLTTGSTYDSMTDVPTLTSTTAANYAVLNVLNKTTSGSAAFDNGNLRITTGIAQGVGYSTIAMSTGKWYAEGVATTGSAPRYGVSDVLDTGQDLIGSSTISKGSSTGELNINGTINNTAPSFPATSIIGLAYDADTRKVWLSVNGTWQNYSGSGADPATGTNPIGILAGSNAAYFGVRSYNGSTNANFGQQPFTYTPPSGFVALNTYNL
jgi:hypothetical protein